MKKIIYLSFFITLSFLSLISCETENQISEDSNSILVAKIKDNKIVIDEKISSKSFLSKWKDEISSQSDLDLNFYEVKVLKIDGNFYLRAYSKEGYVSTKIITQENNMLKMALDGLSCTSSACSDDYGCLPESNGKKCTACPSGDCTKTVTSD